MFGRVFSIEEFSTFDGPGIRTTVFLKGCPLRCTWCHNPEGQLFENEFVRSPNGCLNCEACLDIGEKVTGIRRLAEESISVCPRNLIRKCAVDYTVSELCEKLLRNADILNANGGGITVSGGEPLAQYNFLMDCLKELSGKVHRAIQTSGFCDSEKFKEILKYTDYILYDLKIIDEQQHFKFTGVSNRNIINNFKTLSKSGVPFCIRMPLIPTVTDTKENIEAVAKIMEENNQNYIELLPYNKFSGGKYAMVDKTYNPGFDEASEVQPHLDLFAKHTITSKVL